VGKNDRDRTVPDGIEAEHQITYLLRRLGFYQTMTTELDEEHATDALVTGHRKVKEKRPPIAVQLTKRRKSHGKAAKFVARAGKRFKGPLLYVKLRGRITLEMAQAIKTALFALWEDPERKLKRAHGINAYSDGRLRWFAIPQPPEKT
jgi:hypothetical protein